MNVVGYFQPNARLVVGGWCLFVACLPPLVRGQDEASKPAVAESYRILPISPEFADAKALLVAKSYKKNIIGGLADTKSTEVLDKFDKFYRTYFFYSFTDPKELPNLAAKRQELLKDLSLLNKNQELHDRLSRMAQGAMSLFAAKAVPDAKDPDKKDFHPAVRVNAMLILGELNATEVDLIKRTNAVPKPEVLDMLLAAVADPTQLDGVRLAAMIGVMRHAELSGKTWPADTTRTKVIRQMADVIGGKDVGAAQRTPEGKVWMQRRAIDVLAAIGHESVVTGIVKIATDDKQPLALRCTAARALGRFKLTDKSGVNVVDTAHKLGLLAAFACRQEMERVAAERKAEEERQKQKGGGGGGPAPGQDMGMGGLANLDLDSYKIDLTKRRLKHQIECVQFGLRGQKSEKKLPKNAPEEPPAGGLHTLSFGDPKTKPQVAAIIAAVDKLQEGTDDANFSLTRLKSIFGERLAALEGGAKTAPAARPAVPTLPNPAGNPTLDAPAAVSVPADPDAGIP